MAYKALMLYMYCSIESLDILASQCLPEYCYFVCDNYDAKRSFFFLSKEKRESMSQHLLPFYGFYS